MRITLQEQWNGLLASLEIKKQQFLSQLNTKYPQPEVVYELASHKSLRALRIDGYVIHVGLPSFESDRPTKKSVAALRAIVDEFNPVEADACLSYSYNDGYGHTSGWLKLHDFLNGVRYARTKEELLPKQQELIEKYAPREGYKACDYCGTQRPTADLKPRKIIARQYPGGYKIGHYCGDEGCGGYDQMAHEG